MNLVEKILTSTSMEKAIVAGYNGNNIPEVSGIVDYLRKTTKFNGIAVHVGSKQYSVTPEWAKYNPPKSRPKTDIIIGDYKISVKTVNHMLFSGSKNEYLSTMMCVCNDNKIIEMRALKMVFDTINNLSVKGVSSGPIRKVKKTDESIIIATKNHKEICNVLSTLFTENPIFKMEFIKESLTGRLKFGLTSEASATHLLSIENDDFNLYKINDSLIRKLMKDVFVDVSFKSSNKIGMGSLHKYRYFTVINLVFNKFLNESLSDKIHDFLLTVFSNIQNIASLFEFLEIEPEIKVREVS